MASLLKALLMFVIAVTERALRAEVRPRCIRGGSIAARAARRRQFVRDLDPAHGPAAAVVAAVKP